MLDLDAAAGAAIGALITRAQQRPRPLLEVRRRIRAAAYGHRAPLDTELTIAVPGFVLTYVLEETGGGGLARHLAVATSADQPGTRPPLVTALSLAEREFGFGPVAAGTDIWLETLGNDRRSYHLLQPIDNGAAYLPAPEETEQFIADPEAQEEEEL